MEERRGRLGGQGVEGVPFPVQQGHVLRAALDHVADRHDEGWMQQGQIGYRHVEDAEAVAGLQVRNHREAEGPGRVVEPLMSPGPGTGGQSGLEGRVGRGQDWNTRQTNRRRHEGRHPMPEPDHAPAPRPARILSQDARGASPFSVGPSATP
ncbi:hypothetical protein GALL_524080 [mine drainage metagenome]|uniref:Uncharacterized protein n=1 Tax=mine drainage metagenome TaxID=410659 RepID=A0A1J5PET1_9ZZZZ